MKKLFQRFLAPSVSIEYTLLLFATAIAHHLWFGREHPISRLVALDWKLPAALYVYGGIVALAACIKLNEEWRKLASWLVFIGDAFVSAVLLSLFYLVPSTPSAIDVLANLVYALQALLSLVLVVLSFKRKGDDADRFLVEPVLRGVASPLMAGAVIGFVVMATAVLSGIFSFEPADITGYVTLSGFIILEVARRLRPDLPA